MTISSYPLHWPPGWPQTPASARRNARFVRKERSTASGGGWYHKQRDLTVADAIQRVLEELSRMRVSRDDVVISTNVPTRLDGMPRSGAAEPKEPGAAVWWEERGGARRVVAIDHYDRVADNLAAIAATLEALRAIERHGGARILDRAFTGFTALPAPASAPARHWTVVLGVLRDDTAETVQSAYRNLARMHHPDRGGDAKRMAEINEAYDAFRSERGI